MSRLSLVVAGSTLAALLALAAPSDAAPKKPSRGLIYGGTTSQDDPLTLTLAKGGKKLSAASAFIETTCADGRRLTLPVTFSFAGSVPAFVPPGEHVLAGQRLSKRGAFKAKGRGTELYGTATANVTERLSGTVKRNGSASGTLRASVVMLDLASGAPATTCDSGVLQWTARSERGRIFAGLTSDRMPVVVELDPGGQSLRHLRVGWYAPCTPEGGILYGDRLSNRRMTGGVYTEVFQQTATSPEGGKQVVDYAVNVQAKGSTVSGDITVKITESDPAGATVMTCDTGRDTWTARSG